MTNIIEVENKIITLRDQQVILDSDVAELYGVRSKILTLKNLGRGQHSKYPPKAFTEKGLYMLATILKSPKAVETTIAIVEAYAKLKELSRVMTQIPQQEENSVEQKALLQRGGQLVEGLLTDVMPVRSSETSFELNLAMFKFKHSVKRENDEEIRALKERIEKLEQGEN